MKSFAATPEAVWAIPTDAPGYASWNTTVDGVAGHIALGATITTGLIAPLIGHSIPDLQPAFEEFVSALKKRAERA